MDMTFNDPFAFVGGDEGVGRAPGLRQLTWHGLCARITAAQDLRRALEDIGDFDLQPSSGSFHNGVARFLASDISGVPAQRRTSEQAVNLNSSANSKAVLGTAGPTTFVTRHGRAEARD